MRIVQPEVQRIVELIQQRAVGFANARVNSKHDFNFQLVVDDHLIFFESAWIDVVSQGRWSEDDIGNGLWPSFRSGSLQTGSASCDERVGCHC